ncbi:hypothetical protein [Actinomadura parmotrematis]|uniref:SGNH/GDSL hydrolase family protein n=1 Tax=Actinomadura parmotrematis TaxID=2864039 RepID=A0ABS7FWE2_9ACTN|nr:hypothetical protein [Actinomadura parmotrematis]MBW8483999.1 hypothetical protein [Actinomadura parmotrematis]
MTVDARMKAAAVVAALALAAGVVFWAQRGAGGDAPYRGPLATPGTAPAEAPATRHIALNTQPSDYPRLRALGYDLVDVKPDPALVDAIPAGMRGLMWVGNFTCGAFELDYTAFTEAVRRLARDPRVYGWYLSDEPNPRECPGIAAEIRRRADFIRAHAPGQVSFVSLTDWPMKPVAPKRTHVDLVGLDPYPCKGGTKAGKECNIDAVDRMVRMADEAGVPRRSVVPVFQTFGQSCSGGEREYWLPTVPQLRAILARWDRLVPRPPFDISYSWGHQGEWACPTLADADGSGGRPDLQSVFKERHAARR